MRHMIAFLLVFVTVTAFGQSNANLKQPDVYTPRTLSAGTVMSARTLATTYDDTTQAFQTRGFVSVFVGVETAANDSGRVLLAYQPSKDGVTFDALVLVDSLVTTGTVGKVMYFQLPANAMGAHSVRVRVYGDATVATYSSNPSTTMTTKIIRKHY